MLQSFHTKRPRAIITDVRRFIRDDFFAHFPGLRGAVSVLIVGSVANGRYDERSDIDVDIVCPDTKTRDLYHAGIKAYKRRLRDLGEPFQFHKGKTFDEVVARLDGWIHDGDLRECANALIVEDPHGRFMRIQKRFRHYPAAIHKEKVSWLFAEAVFLRQDRFDVAVARGDRFFAETVKLQIVRLFLNAVLMAERRFPSFDKHLYANAMDSRAMSRELKAAVDGAIRTHDMKKNIVLIARMTALVERTLLKHRLIPKRAAQEWVDARPAYQVELGQ